MSTRLPPALNEDAWRQALRVTVGSLLGLALAKVMDWPFGVFFAVYPILLLGLVPVLNKGIALQFLGSSAASIIVVQALLVVGGVSPPAATIMFFIVSATCFWIMARKRHFLFGAVTIVTMSILAHLASHTVASKADMFTAQAVASFSALVIAIIMHGAMPERRAMQLAAAPAPRLARHQVLLGSICATASYVAFQVLDLGDSLSAQAATVLVLFPMTLSGGRVAVWTRFTGTLIGSASALAIQLALYTHVAHLLLIAIPYAAAMLLFSTLHVREAAGPAVGFSAATAIAVLIGQLSPQSDLYGTALYRFASVSIASLLMLLCMFATHALLNVFPAIRYSMASGDQPGARSPTP